MIRARNRWRWAPTAVASIACVAMLVTVLAAWQPAAPALDLPVAPDRVPPLPAVTVPAKAMISPAPEAAVVERPLFSPSRRPPEAKAPATAGAAGSPAPAAPPPPPEIDFVLVGVVRGGGARVAILQPSDGQPPQQLQEGQSLHGWTVIEIGFDRVSLRNAGIDRELALDFNHGPHGP